MTDKGLTPQEMMAAIERLRLGGFMTGRELTKSTNEQYAILLRAKNLAIARRFRTIW